MKRLMWILSIALLGLMMVNGEAQARRLGGGLSSGMKRVAPPAAPTAVPKSPTQTPQAAPNQSAAPATPPPTAAAAPKRSWTAPLAGLAAGLGLAALASHFGLGAEMANVMGVMLAVMLGALLLSLVMKFLAGRRAPASRGLQGMQFADAGFGYGQAPQAAGQTAEALTTPAAASVAPAGFDQTEFETIAKRVFIRLQAANDAGDLDDLRRFTTPEMFAMASQELLDRGPQAQQTDVVQLQALVIEQVEAEGKQIVSVRFNGLIREEKDAPATPFDEVWHLLRPLDGSREWAIAGIQQTS